MGVSVASAEAPLGQAPFYAGLLLVASGTAVAVVAGGSPALAAAPVAAASAALLTWRAPLRWSVSVLLFGLLALDDTVEGMPGQWHTPFAFVGDLLHFRLDAVARLQGVPVTGMEIALAFLGGVWLLRRLTGSRVDAPGRTPVAGALSWVALLYAVAVLASEAIGLARGLPLAPWKLRHLLHPLALMAICLAAFRGAIDHALLARLVVAAACWRAVLAIVVQRFAVAQTGGPFAHATSHGDSILFAVAACLLLLDVLERPGPGSRRRAWIGLPLILVGAIENNRRIFWVMLLAAMFAAYSLGPWRGWRLRLTRFVVLALPLFALYASVGWNRSGRIFGPVQTLRGLVDTSVNRSSLWRDVENWNIAMSLRESPLIGLGLGGHYTEVMPNDDMSRWYKEYREWPHNAFLGLLMLMGPIGFAAVQALLALALLYSLRSYRAAADAGQRLAALTCLAAIVACEILAWGDLGPRFPQYKVFAALAIAVSARLAVATGAWPPARRSRVAPAPAGAARTRDGLPRLSVPRLRDGANGSLS